MEDLLRDILFELKEINRKLSSLDNGVDKITACGMCDLSDVKDAVESIAIGGVYTIADVCDKLDNIADKP